ncbi:LAETG motif-containing sortase-dependent surface protein [Streptomyces sp. NPDC127100]|uniref:LAETG motif-containing sortase-dependent surface protein n=1 Tax=Streptomyces sp. NPDC127100 TaxID=3347138 RepID=UPI00364A24F8
MRSAAGAADGSPRRYAGPGRAGTPTWTGSAGDGLPDGIEAEDGRTEKAAGTGKPEDLAATGGDAGTLPPAAGGAALVVAGAGALVLIRRRRRA